MSTTVRIGSRDSALATWQAKEVQRLLTEKNIPTEIVFIKSMGDLNQDSPLHMLNAVGVFTKALDDALLDGRIDIAVHSCKDLPSVMHPELQLCGFLEREDSADVIVSNKPIDFFDDKDFSGTIATGSVRRRAQLLAQFPKANIVGLRGNVPTRLQKLKDNDWDGAVFALAGLHRLGIKPEHYKKADFMISAPSQGVVAIGCRKGDADFVNVGQLINHRTSEITTKVEREFLRLMEGGCISPIGGYAKIENETITLNVNVLTPDGDRKVEYKESIALERYGELAHNVYEKVSAQGAKEIIKNIEMM